MWTRHISWWERDRDVSSLWHIYTLCCPCLSFSDCPALNGTNRGWWEMWEVKWWVVEWLKISSSSLLWGSRAGVGGVRRGWGWERKKNKTKYMMELYHRPSPDKNIALAAIRVACHTQSMQAISRFFQRIKQSTAARFGSLSTAALIGHAWWILFPLQTLTTC